MRKVVVLNSGGFDSIVLLYHLVKTKCDGLLEDEEIEFHSLHFTYFEKNSKEQIKCVRNVCDKLNVVNHVICLPRFDWTRSSFYQNPSNSYLEYRNLVFLSYAVSFAESIGAKEIYMSLLRSEYKDSNTEFVENFNYLIAPSEIVLVTPFIHHKKEFLKYIAEYYKIGHDEYFSCDYPIDKKPCGECKDCLELKALNLL